MAKGSRSRGRGRGRQKPLEERIVEALKKAQRPIYMREIRHFGRFAPHEKHLIKPTVQELVREGRVVHLKGNRYGLLEMMELITGKLTVHPDGFGFVAPEKPGAPDVFVPRPGLKGAVHGDKVIVRIEKHRKKGPEGSVVRILERGVNRLVGTFFKGKRVSVVVPEDERLLFEVVVPGRQTKGARDGDVVVAEIDHFSQRGHSAEGRIVEVLGDPNDMAVQTKIVVEKYELPHRFSRECMEEAEALPSAVRPEDLRGRRDLRDLPLVTIDGETARDFDDAVHVKKTRNGYILTVAIADVSHYVHRGSPIDQDAYIRSTSTYFPNGVIPMLPEALSNHLCSLVPDQDRLCMCARVTFDRRGQVVRSSFFKGVTRSHRRFTYTEVKKILVDRDPELMEREWRLLPMLEWMRELAELLHARRLERGSIDFDLPEPQVVLGMTGELEEIVRRERNIAHQIIEEFMIAANEAVAHFLSQREIPTLYRVHDLPDQDKIEDFVKFARTLGMDVKPPRKMEAGWFQKVLAMAQGKPHEYVVNAVLLRSMKQAVYSPDNIGHFGLASPFYLHFTSPIRRYPDLIVHRILKANLHRVRKRPVYDYETLVEAGHHCSQRERVAMEAEREVFERFKVRFMADKIGETYEGVISSVTSFGFFVELKEIFIDGAVRLVDIADDYYELDHANHRLVGKRTGRVFQVGQPVKVVVKDVNIARRHINFALVEEEGQEAEQKGGRGGRRGARRRGRGGKRRRGEE